MKTIILKIILEIFPLIIGVMLFDDVRFAKPENSGYDFFIEILTLGIYRGAQ